MNASKEKEIEAEGMPITDLDRTLLGRIHQYTI